MMTRPRRAVAAAHLFLLAAALAGVVLVEGGVEYRIFGLVEGLFSLLLTYLLIERGGWWRPTHPLEWLPIAYGAIAGAQLLEMLLPPPGMIQWVFVSGIAIASWSAFAGASRHRLMVSLGTLAILLALVKHSVIPALWDVGPEAGTGFGIGDTAERARRAIADYRPVRPAGQLLSFLAVTAWVFATRLLWPAEHPVRVAKIPLDEPE